MHGNNGDFGALDAADGTTDNSLNRQVFLPNTYDAVRIAMTWLTRGSNAYDHKDDAHAIGMDLDLHVLDVAVNFYDEQRAHAIHSVICFPP